jgi:hypothetical protein
MAKKSSNGPVEIWISECGRYLARQIPDEHTWLDVIEIATGTTWLVRRYKPTGWDDPRLRFAEFSRMVTGWSNRGRGTRDGRWIRAFELTFADVDTTIEIVALSGNVVRRSYTATFRRLVPAAHRRRHAWAAETVGAAVREMAMKEGAAA